MVLKWVLSELAVYLSYFSWQLLFLSFFSHVSYFKLGRLAYMFLLFLPSPSLLLFLCLILITWDLVQFVHPSVEYWLALSAYMSFNMLAKYWSRRDHHIGWHVDLYAGWHSTDMSAGVSATTRLHVRQHVDWYVGRYMTSILVDTQPIRGVPIVGGILVNCQWNIDWLLVAYRSTVV